MKLGNITLYVKNVLETVEFYEKAFNLKRAFVFGDNEYAQMQEGLAFCHEDFMKDQGIIFFINRANQPSSGFEISFPTKDIQNTFDTALAAGAMPVIYPTKRPWSQTIAYVKDNNGILIELNDTAQEECCAQATYCL